MRESIKIKCSDNILGLCDNGNFYHDSTTKYHDYHDNGIYPSNTPKHYKHSIVRVENSSL